MDKVTCLPDAFFHYRIRNSSISRTRSVSSLIDFWLARSRRQADLPDISDELQAILTRDRVFEAFRTWCWLASCPREDR